METFPENSRSQNINVYEQDVTDKPRILEPKSSSQHTIQVVSGHSVAEQPMREESPPSTTCVMSMAWISCLFCAWICGIFAIIYTYRATSEVRDGKFAKARESVRFAWVLIAISVLVGLAVWIYFGITYFG